MIIYDWWLLIAFIFGVVGFEFMVFAYALRRRFGSQDCARGALSITPNMDDDEPAEPSAARLPSLMPANDVREWDVGEALKDAENKEREGD
ncbi:MAG: hypothetical protein AAB886_01090 [Patescibacteria group bacterium]